MEQQTGKGVHQGCILSPSLFNLHAELIMQNGMLDEAQAGIKIARSLFFFFFLEWLKIFFFGSLLLFFLFFIYLFIFNFILFLNFA